MVLDILHQNDSLGAPVNFLTQGPIGLKETPLLQVFGLDNLNSNNDPGSDGVFDFIDGVLINSSNGRIYFPTTKPFGCAVTFMLKILPTMIKTPIIIVIILIESVANGIS